VDKIKVSHEQDRSWVEQDQERWVCREHVGRSRFASSRFSSAMVDVFVAPRTLMASTLSSGLNTLLVG
jgi:hypothetical protein